jgi:predicted alpha/beta superfamily hydrolase
MSGAIEPAAGRSGMLDGIDAVDIASAASGSDYRVFTALRDRGDGRAPVALYVTDAAMSFGTAVETVQRLQDARMLPSMLVVGIGYPVEGVAATIPLRYRDLTPTPDPAWPDPDSGASGGAARFLAFLRTELQPWIRATYGTAPDEDTYFGHSLGGLFGAYALLTAPDTFRRYGLGSPSFWWHREVAFELEASFAATHEDLAADVFVSVGVDEGFDGADRDLAHMAPGDAAAAAAQPFPHDMVEVIGRMVARLESRRYPGLRLGTMVLPGENHMTAMPVNLSRGLRFLLDQGRPRS